MVRDPSAWSLKSKTRLISVLFSGILGHAFQAGVTTWCLQKTGPVFVSIFAPLGIVITAIFDWSCNSSLRILRSDLGEVTRGDQEGRRRGKFWPCLVLSKSPLAAKQEQR